MIPRCCMCGADITPERWKKLMSFSHGVVKKWHTCSPECASKFRKRQFVNLARYLKASARARYQEKCRKQDAQLKNFESLPRPLRPPVSKKDEEE